MPYYYHVSRGPEESSLITDFDKDRKVFLSIKDVEWNNIEKEVGKNAYGGYREYELCIPSNRFTESLNPRTNNKILKITNKNKKEVKKLVNQFINEKNIFSRHLFIEELKKRNFIGVDTHFNLSKGKFGGWNYELIIFDFSSFLPDLKLVEVVVSDIDENDEE